MHKDDTVIKTESKRSKSNPLITFLDEPQQQIENILTMGPEKSAWAESIFQGANYDELDKLAPITEKQLKQIFPRATATRMVDPLKSVDKARIHDNVTRDGSSFMSLYLLALFTVGAENIISLGLNRKYANKERESEQLALIQDNPAYLDILEDLMNRDDDVDLLRRKIELVFSASAFGRAVAVKQYGENDLPCRLIPLSSAKLGRIWVDKYNWDFLGVEYLDYTSDKRILLAKDVIHYEENDFSITPNSRYYGMSLAAQSMAIGERNRAANEIAIPEIMKRYFTPLMKVMTHTKSQAKLNQIKNAWKSGKVLFLNDDIEVEVIPIQHDLEKVRDTVYEGAKQIYRNASVPLGVAYQDEQNRATLEGSVLAWYEGPIAFRRSILDSAMWRQWYKPQLDTIQENNLAEKMANTEGIFNYLEQMQTKRQQLQTGTGQLLPFRIVTEYKNVRTVGFLDTAAAVAQFYDRKLLNGDMAREETGLSKYNDDMAIEEQQRQIMANNMFSQQQTTLNPFMNQQSTDQNYIKNPAVKDNLGTPDLTTQSTSNFGKSLPSKSTEY